MSDWDSRHLRRWIEGKILSKKAEIMCASNRIREIDHEIIGLCEALEIEADAAGQKGEKGK
jgi:hypothetical protein